MPIKQKNMMGEKSGFNPQEEEWFKKGEEMKDSEKLPTDGEITAKTDTDVAETDTEKDWFKKVA